MGAGSALFFAPVAATVLGAVAPTEQGQASGVATAVRELAVVVGIAVLASVFARYGDLTSSAGLLAGIGPALWWGAALAAAGRAGGVGAAGDEGRGRWRTTGVPR